MIVAIIPIFLHKGQFFWQDAEGQALIDELIHRAQNLQEVEKTIILTNTDAIDPAHFDSRQVEIFHVHHNNGSASEVSFVPEEFGEALQYMIKAGKISDSQKVVLLNFRNPFLSNALLHAAIERFNNTGAHVMLSIRKCTDHPCQLASCRHIHQAGFIHIFENDAFNRQLIEQLNQKHPSLFQPNSQYRGYADLDSSIVSRPFPFDWEEVGIYDKEPLSLFRRGYHPRFPSYLKVDSPEDEDIHDLATPLYVYVNPLAARVIFDGITCQWIREKREFYEKRSLELIGADTYAISEHIFVLAQKDNRQVLGEIFSKGKPDRLVLGQACHNGLQSSWELKDLVVDLVKGPSRLHPLCITIDKCGGFYYALLGYAEDTTCDCCEFFSSIPRLWEMDYHKGIAVNLATRKPITGRQDFPEIYEPDGSFLFLNGISHFGMLQNKKNRSHICGYVLDEGESLSIESELDVVKYKAIQSYFDKNRL